MWRIGHEGHTTATKIAVMQLWDFPQLQLIVVAFGKLRVAMETYCLFRSVLSVTPGTVWKNEQEWPSSKPLQNKYA